MRRLQLDRADAYRHSTLATMGRGDQDQLSDRVLSYQRRIVEGEVQLKDNLVAANAAAVSPAIVPPPTSR